MVGDGNDLPDGIDLVERLDEAKIDQLVALYDGQWWTRGRSREDVAAMLEGCAVVIGLVERGGGRLVGFARALSDGAFKALIFDVIVAPDRQGTGLGAVLMDRLLAHPGVARARHVELYCLPEMEPFYRRWGFSADVAGTRLMRRPWTP